ncbi:MAG: hypothetical protein J7L08_03230 [Candidatus Aenigmarchaeota archaeon]|nr:hypothetical protein [Candidatus Aenigmarchaeota archaeon]
MSLGYEILTCNRCGKKMKSTDAHPTEIVLMSPACKSCGDYRIKCRERAYEKYKSSIRGETVYCFSCDGKGYIDGIKCPECEGKGKIPIEIESLDTACRRGFLNRFLPSDYDRK